MWIRFIKKKKIHWSIGAFGSTGTYGSIPLKRTSPLLEPGERFDVSDDDSNDGDD